VIPVWGDPRDLPGPAPLRETVRADVCVVGLGGSGLAAVGALLEAGADVVGIDAGPVGGGAAGRNGGFLLAGGALFHHVAVEAWGHARAVAIYEASLAEIDRLAAELGDVVRRVGSLRAPAGADEAADCARHREALERGGFPAAELDGGVLVPSDGAIDPLARCRLLAGRATAAGARLHAGTPATGIASGRVTTPHGAVACRAVVVAVDGGLEQVLGELAGRVRSTRLQMLATEPLAETVAPRPVYHRWGYDYWQQLPDGRIALGGGRDRHAAAEWGAPAEPDAAVQRELDRVLREDVGVEAAVTHRWAGVVGYTEDRLPVLEAVRPGVIAVGAHSGHGNVLGSAAAREAADSALGRPPGPLTLTLESRVR
jgi:gamma-glutamylputrescine oxidase